MVAKIIVNNVDVSECKYVDIIEERKNYIDLIVCVACKEDITDYKECENNPNCYYKQLKRLEAEDEELKEKNEELIAQLSRFYRNKEYIRLLKYKQALEEIRAIALDIIENDCYENSDTKAKKIIDIIYPLFLTDKEKQEAKELAEKISKYPEDFNI